MITPSIARMLVQEHLYKRITGKVLCLGRQLIPLTHEEAIATLREAGYHVLPEAIEATRGCVEERTRYAKDKGWLTDTAFFRLLGIEDVVTMDVSDYEGCEIVHNLNDPVPSDLHNKFDFIIDGGTFDHLVDIRHCFENVANMLTPGGRILQWNAASNFTGMAYLSFGPDFFYDYYVLNKFNDCKIYIAEGDDIAQMADWDIYHFNNPESYQQFVSPKIQMVLVLAEKAADSTCGLLPVQRQYRPPAVAELYLVGESRAKHSKRPVWIGKKPALPEQPAPVLPPHPQQIQPQPALVLPPLQPQPAPVLSPLRTQPWRSTVRRSRRLLGKIARTFLHETSIREYKQVGRKLLGKIRRTLSRTPRPAEVAPVEVTAVEVAPVEVAAVPAPEVTPFSPPYRVDLTGFAFVGQM